MACKKISLLRGRGTVLYHQHLEARRRKGRWERGIRDTFMSHLKWDFLLFVCYSLEIDIRAVCHKIHVRIPLWNYDDDVLN